MNTQASTHRNGESPDDNYDLMPLVINLAETLDDLIRFVAHCGSVDLDAVTTLIHSHGFFAGYKPTLDEISDGAEHGDGLFTCMCRPSTDPDSTIYITRAPQPVFRDEFGV